MHTSVIIEDLPNDLEVVKTLLRQYYSTTIQLAGTANTMEEGISLLEKTQPHLVFLDIELGEHLSFQMFERSKALRAAKVIFTTGHSKYVELAFDMNAVNYILKPVGPERFKKVVDKALASNGQKMDLEVIMDLPGYFGENPPANPRIQLKGQREVRFTYLEDIELAEADSTCCKFWYYQRDRKITEFTTTTNLGAYEKIWEPYKFMYRLGRKYLVNLKYAEKISNLSNSPKLHLASGKTIDIPDGKIRDLEQAIMDYGQ